MDGNELGISTIAQRYSSALIELGESSNLLDAFDSDLNNIKATFDSSKELKTLLEHPTIPIQDKKDILLTIFNEKVSKYIINFLMLLLDKNRMFLFGSIVSNYHNTLNKKRSISIAQVITPIEIDYETQMVVKGKLERIFQQQIELDLKVNPEIIAGMIVKVGDKLIDGSIKTKLENMKKQVI